MKADGQHALWEVIAGVAAKAHQGDELAQLELHVANGRAEQKVQHLEREIFRCWWKSSALVAVTSLSDTIARGAVRDRGVCREALGED